jgi:hypothetical protein
LSFAKILGKTIPITFAKVIERSINLKAREPFLPKGGLVITAILVPLRNGNVSLMKSSCVIPSALGSKSQPIRFSFGKYLKKAPSPAAGSTILSNSLKEKCLLKRCKHFSTSWCAV